METPLKDPEQPPEDLEPPSVNQLAPVPAQPSGGASCDEPEHGTPPIVIRDSGQARRIGSKNAEDEAIDEAAEESFPASDPPAWTASVPGRRT